MKHRKLATLFAIVAGALGAVSCGGSDEAMTPAQPVVQPSVESHVSQMEGPSVEKTHANQRAELSIVGERAGQLRRNIPLASPSQRGCTTKLVRNFASRGGVAPSMFVLHYTVSANRAGFSDMDAIYNWFNQSRSQASSHYIIDFEGHCYLIVSEANKAWTQGSFNPASISIEFIATGRESTSAWTNAALRKGALVVSDALKRWDIPLRLVDPAGCVVTAGITDHNRLECGNFHHDVAPNFPTSKFMRFVREASAPCFKYAVVDNGDVLLRSAKFKAGDGPAKLPVFLAHDLTQKALLGRLGSGDNDVTLDRLRVTC